MVPAVVAALAVFALGCAGVSALADRRALALRVMAAAVGLAVIAAGLAIWGDLARPKQCRSGSKTYPRVVTVAPSPQCNPFDQECPEPGGFVLADCPRPTAGLYDPF